MKNFPEEFSGLVGKTLFLSAANCQAVLVTRSAKKMRQRFLDFPDAHAALDWCLNHSATFVMLPCRADPKLN
jgi:hypothetical protein